MEHGKPAATFSTSFQKFGNISLHDFGEVRRSRFLLLADYVSTWSSWVNTPPLVQIWRPVSDRTQALVRLDRARMLGARA